MYYALAICIIKESCSGIASKLNGEAIQIVKPKEGGGFVLEKSQLEKIVSNRELRNLEVMILSVAGAFRKGKSFLLNLILRYQQYLEKKRSCAIWQAYETQWPEWLGNGKEPLEGTKYHNKIIVFYCAKFTHMYICIMLTI